MRSEPAFDAEYGERGSSGSVSADEPDLDRAVDLVGADVHHPADLEPARGVHHHVGAEAVGVDEVVGPDDRAVDVALRREVHDGVVAAHRVLERLGIADVALHELVARIVVDVAERREVAGVRERVVHGHRVVGGREHVAHVVRADEPRAAGDEDLPTHVRRPQQGRSAPARSARRRVLLVAGGERRLGHAPVGGDGGVVPRHARARPSGCSSRRPGR